MPTDRRPRDVNQLAHRLVAESLGEAERTDPPAEPDEPRTDPPAPEQLPRAGEEQ